MRVRILLLLTIICIISLSCRLACADEGDSDQVTAEGVGDQQEEDEHVEQTGADAGADPPKTDDSTATGTDDTEREAEADKGTTTKSEDTDNDDEQSEHIKHTEHIEHEQTDDADKHVDHTDPDGPQPAADVDAGTSEDKDTARDAATGDEGMNVGGMGSGAGDGSTDHSSGDQAATDDEATATTDEDKNVRADEESLQNIEHEREELAKKLHVVELLKKRMAMKKKLLQRVRALQEKVTSTSSEEDQARQDKATAEENYRLAMIRRNATEDERESTAREREEMEKVLDELKNEKKSFEEEFIKLSADKKKTQQMEDDLKKQKRELIESLELTLRKFRFQGFHRWLESNMQDYPQIIRETILKTGSTLNPFLEGIGEISNLNEEISKQTLQYMPSIRKNSFYAGLVYYLFLLFPTVAVFWLIIRIRQRLALLTVEHYVIILNLYFGIMSTICMILTLSNKKGTDILATLRQESKHIAEPFMIVHGVLFVVHLILHGLTAYVSGSRKDFIQYLIMSCIGLHFFTHAYKRTILNRDPNIGSPAYFLYAVAFLYVLYDRGIHIIEAVIRGRKAGLSAFGTFPMEDYDLKDPASPSTGLQQQQFNGSTPSFIASGTKLPRSTGDRNVDTTVYFAGLPMFNAPSQSSLTDAKTM